MRSTHRVQLWGLLLIGLATASTPAWAENLMEAYQQAYQTDPVLAQARADLRAEMQDTPLARSALLPHLGAGAGAGFGRGESRAGPTGAQHPGLREAEGVSRE